MQMKKAIILMMTALTTGLVYTGCKEAFLEKNNPNTVSDESFYKTANDAVRAVNAAYGALQLFGTYAREYYMMTDLVADDIAPDPGADDWAEQRRNFLTTSSNGMAYNIWRDMYAGVFRANTVIEKVPGIPMEEGTRNRILGEAHFLRAYYYFDLVRLWGEVPVVTGTSSDDANLFQPKKTVAEVYGQIVADLSTALELLPPKQEYGAGDLGRATQGSAAGLLGKVYVYRKEYALAADLLGKLINGTYGAYRLVENYGDNFREDTENNSESVFEVQFSSKEATGNVWSGGGTEGHVKGAEFSISRGFGNAYVSQYLLDAYAPEDTERKEATVVALPGNPKAVHGYEIAKYIRPGSEFQDQVSSGINIRVLRLADLLLLHAEALNELGQTAQAYGPLNLVRGRAGLAPLTAATLPEPAQFTPGLAGSDEQARLRDAIVKERFVELAVEENRWFDLVRWGIAEPVMKARGRSSFVRGKDEYLPIPQIELDVNKRLAQNPAYQ